MENCEKLQVPKPPYTYNRGVAYSVGEDRYPHILKTIYSRAMSYEVQYYNMHLYGLIELKLFNNHVVLIHI